jgi:hypothetical protein
LIAASFAAWHVETRPALVPMIYGPPRRPD